MENAFARLSREQREYQRYIGAQAMYRWEAFLVIHALGKSRLRVRSSLLSVRLEYSLSLSRALIFVRVQFTRAYMSKTCITRCVLFLCLFAHTSLSHYFFFPAIFPFVLSLFSRSISVIAIPPLLFQLLCACTQEVNIHKET